MIVDVQQKSFPKTSSGKDFANEPASNLRRRRSINVDVRLCFLRLGRGGRIYDRRISFLFLGLLRWRIRYRCFFLLASSEQRDTSEQANVFLHINESNPKRNSAVFYGVGDGDVASAGLVAVVASGEAAALGAAVSVFCSQAASSAAPAKMQIYFFISLDRDPQSVK